MPRPASQTADPVCFSEEHVRIVRRRLRFGRAADAPKLALALSGGGIRSATFSLGVMQALAKAKLEDASVPLTAAGPDTDSLQGEASWLARFDYLSTVSGGGYLGAFFCSLFVPGRFRQQTTPESAAADAYAVMRVEPPPRFSTSRRTRTMARQVDALAGRSMPLAWLRENGRYLLPTGAGDTAYALALFIRNLLSVHGVLGTLAVLLLGLLAWSGAGLAAWAGLDTGLRAALASGKGSDFVLWWSPLWRLLPALLLLWCAPAALAYWLKPRVPGRGGYRPGHWLWLALALLVAYFECFATWPPQTGFWRYPAWGILWLGLAARALQLGYGWMAQRKAPGEAGAGGEYRVGVTRSLSASLLLLLGLFTLALVETLGQSLYLYLQRTSAGSLTLSSLVAALGAALAGVRYLARVFDEKSPSGWIARLPLPLLTAVAGVLLALVVLMLWACLVQAVAWGGALPASGAFASGWRLFLLVLLALVLAVLAGSPADFLRLSSLQQFYAARLTRAYLGASNGLRFASKERRAYSSAEPMPGDDLTLADYYGHATLAPLHLINCALNQTLGPAEQLVQRDRKGKPVCLAPGADDQVRFWVDGQAVRLHVPHGGVPQLGRWVAISGAAFSTGLGRATSLGSSLLCGLANIRLGDWQMLRGSGLVSRPVADEWPWRAFANQLLLLREWSGRFRGLHSRWQYLSDGGHFENTGVYELLRPGRQVKLIVACDCGADPDYRFDDLANLVRLARVDFALEIEVDQYAATHKGLRDVFTTPDALRLAQLQRKHVAQAEDDTRCAILLNVYPAADPARGEPVCRIVLIKPRVVSGMPADLLHYASNNPAFPQQTTIDQFFDDQQWESYRKLGLFVGEMLFAQEGGDRQAATALHCYLAL
ncbi:patatin-like phospholipase domain-containing protein [Craterilacuibacter sinensis]|uniref:PNPLA domain-containing protein n=1 Tax=Craterilacuibacter sinensis TaxID=2686017 RepID=A0A845BMK4_9NEIS|nr:patatin-like phospholipase family protein [Craterilacuibacter sinensis]MXR36504.1 hypothetical protein [Craterilacuibacter sinensis]